MIDKKYHIIISGDSSSKTRAFLIHRETIITCVKTSVVVAAVLGLILAIGSWKSFTTLKTNKDLQAQVAKLSNQLISQETNQQVFDQNLFGNTIEIVVNEDEISKGQEAINSSQDDTLEGVITRQEELTPPADESESYQADELRVADIGENDEILSTTANPQLEDTINRLDERSRLIESVMNKIGVYVQVKEDGKNSGGPYISPERAYTEKLLNKTDHYINILEKLPLGRPISGQITSKFGWRSDPFLKKPALHGGADIKGKIGDKVEATADGKVVFTGYDRGGYGHYIRISHENDYESIFGHLSKILVKKGDKITRKQIIGLVGNSGRSTGPHLHYELRYKGRHINPERYMRVADLVFFLSN